MNVTFYQMRISNWSYHREKINVAVYTQCSPVYRSPESKIHSGIPQPHWKEYCNLSQKQHDYIT